GSAVCIPAVFPPIERRPPPAWYAFPGGMFSVHAAIAWTSYGTPSSDSAAMAEITAAAPAMSIFMSSIDADGLSDNPPESNVTPLPISAMRLRGFDLGL